MRILVFICGLLSLAFVSLSCGGEKRKPVYFDENDFVFEEENSYAKSGESIIVPFRNDNGIKYVQVKINGVRYEMIFDTGCSNTLISIAEANYLYLKGSLTDDDFYGFTKASIADGSVVENMAVNLKEVIIDDKILCSNVLATVSKNVEAPLLLGNEILDRVATITIDNENETLNFRIK